METKVNLTELQKRTFDLYVRKNMKQTEVAKEIYGREDMQGNVAHTLRAISKKLGYNVTRKYGKGGSAGVVDLKDYI